MGGCCPRRQQTAIRRRSVHGLGRDMVSNDWAVMGGSVSRMILGIYLAATTVACGAPVPDARDVFVLNATARAWTIRVVSGGTPSPVEYQIEPSGWSRIPSVAVSRTVSVQLVDGCRILAESGVVVTAVQTPVALIDENGGLADSTGAGSPPSSVARAQQLDNACPRSSP